MSIELHTTKKYLNLPCAHAQYFDQNADGTPGHCAALHGYDRSVELTFSGTPDENGWLVPFGGLKKVKEFIEYYLDHVSVLPADDPRIASIPEHMTQPGGVLGTLRVLPYGVSMEMTSLFLWVHISPFITSMTNGRCYVSKVQCYEHERNSAMIQVDKETAMKRYDNYVVHNEPVLPKKPVWTYVHPHSALYAYK